MKPITAGVYAATAFLGSLLLLAPATPISAQSAGAQPAQSPSPASPPGSFAKVAGMLDEGGSFYLIWDMGGAIRGFLDSAEKLAQATGEPQAVLGFPVVRSVVRELGFEQLGYLGISNGRDKRGRSRQSIFLQAPERRGLLALGGEPRSLELLRYAPESSVLVSVASFEFSKVIPMIEATSKAALGAMGGQQVQEGLNKLKKREGIDLPALLQTVGNEVGFVVWLDESSTMKIEGRRGDKVELPRPRVAALLNTSGDDLFRLITRENAKSDKATSVTQWEGWEILAAPESQEVEGLMPLVAWRDGLTVVAESTATLRGLVETHKSGQDIRTSPEWKSLSEDLPTEMLKVIFISPRTTRAILRAVEQIPANRKQDRTAKKVIQELLRQFGAGMVSVSTYKDEGFLSITIREKP